VAMKGGNKKRIIFIQGKEKGEGVYEANKGG